MKRMFKWQNLVFLLILTILIIPQTRHPIQLFVHKGLSLINQSTVIDKDQRKSISYTNWQLVSDTGEIVDLSKLKGKVVFVNFWATWCPPCIVEMPSLANLYEDYKNEVVFLFVTNEDLETVEKFKAKNNYSFKVFNPIDEIPEELKTTSIPRTFIINKTGEIVVDEKGAIDWYSKKVQSQLDDLTLE